MEPITVPLKVIIIIIIAALIGYFIGRKTKSNIKDSAPKPSAPTIKQNPEPVSKPQREQKQAPASTEENKDEPKN